MNAAKGRLFLREKPAHEQLSTERLWDQSLAACWFPDLIIPVALLDLGTSVPHVYWLSYTDEICSMGIETVSGACCALKDHLGDLKLISGQRIL